MKKIYLASPYSHPDKSVRENRFRAACKAASLLMVQGYLVFSPIAHSHTIAQYLDNHLDLDFWLEIDLSFLDSWADEMWILCIPGWWESKGIRREIEHAKKHGIHVSEYHRATYEQENDPYP